VLGAHHGLISTYALETLVLYVINLYHRDLTNPLQVRGLQGHGCGAVGRLLSLCG
jgi:hypothetical protein